VTAARKRRSVTDEPEAAVTTGDPSVDELGFDAALAEFQRVVAVLESGGQPLEEALQLYERGMRLQERLDRLLTDAELRIRRLVERSGGRLETVELAEDAPEP
jgi:exodeoxyribonuclease VII small subunit